MRPSTRHRCWSYPSSAPPLMTFLIIHDQMAYVTFSRTYCKYRRFYCIMKYAAARAGRGGGMADALRSGRSVRKGMGVQISPSAPPAGLLCRIGAVWMQALVAQLDRAQ